MRIDRRALARIALVSLIFFLVIYVANIYPSLLPIQGIPGAALVECVILLVSLVAMWNAELLHGVQAKSRLAFLEVAVLTVVLVSLMLINGIDCNPLTLCITVAGSYMGEPVGVYISLISLNTIVAVSEELFSRGYLLRDLYHGFNSGVIAVSVSALVFAISHAPTLSLASFNTSPIMFLLASIFVVGLSYGLVYWWTGWNLMLVVVMHFFYDTFGGMITLVPFDPFDPLRFYAVLVVIPGAAIVLFHQAWKRFSWPTPERGKI